MLNPCDILQQGKYRIIKAFGGGGMGRVYQAEHTMLKTTVAIPLKLAAINKLVQVER